MDVDGIGEIKKLQINTGPYTGGYIVAPNGMLNWYFATFGLLPLVKYFSQADLITYVLRFLNLYLSKVDPVTFTIKDVQNPLSATPTLVLSDSDDAYAATFLSLASTYVTLSENWAWLDENHAKLTGIAFNNIVKMQKPSGLISVFQPPRNATNSIGYLLDNAEDYRGLKDFAVVLRKLGVVAEAISYERTALAIAAGLLGLFDEAREGFKASDVDTQATTTFYPGVVAQVYIQAFGITELGSYYNKAWAYVERYAPDWEDGHYDPFPWAIIGYVAALRFQFKEAQKQMRITESRFVSNRAVVTINELGFYQRTKNVLIEDLQPRDGLGITL